MVLIVKQSISPFLVLEYLQMPRNQRQYGDTLLPLCCVVVQPLHLRMHYSDHLTFEQSFAILRLLDQHVLRHGVLQRNPLT
jgi:hypothetical protein